MISCNALLDMNQCRINIRHIGMQEQQQDVSCAYVLLDWMLMEEVLQMGNVECTNHIL